MSSSWSSELQGMEGSNLSILRSFKEGKGTHFSIYQQRQSYSMQGKKKAIFEILNAAVFLILSCNKNSQPDLFFITSFKSQLRETTDSDRLERCWERFQGKTKFLKTDSSVANVLLKLAFNCIPADFSFWWLRNENVQRSSKTHRLYSGSICNTDVMKKARLSSLHHSIVNSTQKYLG